MEAAYSLEARLPRIRAFSTPIQKETFVMPTFTREASPVQPPSFEVAQTAERSRAVFKTSTEGEEKKKERYTPKKPAKGADFDDWVEYYLERMQGRDISKTEVYVTIGVGAALAILIPVLGWAYWPLVVTWLPFLTSLITKKVLGYSLMGAVGSWVKGSIRKTLTGFFKERIEEWKKQEEAKKKAKELHKGGGSTTLQEQPA